MSLGSWLKIYQNPFIFPVILKLWKKRNFFAMTLWWHDPLAIKKKVDQWSWKMWWKMSKSYILEIFSWQKKSPGGVLEHFAEYFSRPYLLLMSFKSEATILKTSKYIWWEFKDLEAYNQLLFSSCYAYYQVSSSRKFIWTKLYAYSVGYYFIEWASKKSLNIPGFSCLYFMARGHCVKNARMRVISEPYTGM